LGRGGEPRVTYLGRVGEGLALQWASGGPFPRLEIKVTCRSDDFATPFDSEGITLAGGFLGEGAVDISFHFFYAIGYGNELVTVT